MSETKKENPAIPEYIKTILGIPGYEETPKEPKISYDPESLMMEPSFSYNFQNDLKAWDGNLSKIAEQFSDSDFFDTETGKKMIEADGALRENSPLQSENHGSPGCSSWVPCTRKKVKDIPRLLYDVNYFKNKDSDVRISEYMKVCSESLGDSFLTLQSENPDSPGCSSWPLYTRKKRKYIPRLLYDVNFKYEDSDVRIREYMKDFSESLGDSLLPIFEPDSSATSTPVKKRMSLLSCNLETQTKDKFDFSNVTLRDKSFQSFNISNKNDSFFSIGNTPKKLQYTTPIMEKYKQYIGSSNYKHLKRLESAEAEKHALVRVESPMDSLRFVGDKSDCVEQWSLQPNEVTIDSKKGARVLLINKSEKNIRFTSRCDGKVINICPLCGVIPARNQIGLRIAIAQQFKKNLQNTEEEVKIFVGKNVQTIHLRIVNEQKPKIFQERKFITY